VVKRLILATLVAAAAAILVASVAPTRYGGGSKATRSGAAQAGYAAPQSQAQPARQTAYSGSGKNVVVAQQAPSAQQGGSYGQSGQGGSYGQSGQSGASGASGSAAAAGQAPAGKVKLVTSLTGKEEVPGPGDPGGTGQAWVTVEGNRVCWKVSWSGLSQPATASHIHFAAKGIAGAVVVPFFGDGRKASGKGVDQGCTTVQNAAVTNGLRNNPSSYYVNVHTSQYPKGAIRGQLALAGGSSLAQTGAAATPTLLGLGFAVVAAGFALLATFRYRPRRLAAGGAHARRR
jgi:hypothetical protein